MEHGVLDTMGQPADRARRNRLGWPDARRARLGTRTTGRHAGPQHEPGHQPGTGTD